jgi:hypothetical protein
VEVVELGRHRSGLPGPVGAHAAHDVDVLDERPSVVARDPVAGRVVHGVARGAAHADELPVRPGPVADARDVLVAVGVELGGAHQDVAAPVPGDVEDPRERQQALDVCVGVVGDRRFDRQDAVDEEGPAVRDEQVRFERRLGQARPERRDGADGAREDLARTAPDVGARCHALLGTGEVAHDDATFRRYSGSDRSTWPARNRAQAASSAAAST